MVLTFVWRDQVWMSSHGKFKIWNRQGVRYVDFLSQFPSKIKVNWWCGVSMLGTIWVCLKIEVQYFFWFCFEMNHFTSSHLFTPLPTSSHPSHPSPRWVFSEFPNLAATTAASNFQDNLTESTLMRSRLEVQDTAIHFCRHETEKTDSCLLDLCNDHKVKWTHR